ncbi:hypothetical protein L914_04093 [Phytophthora nicotianae]|uniref:Uncharacterized protein n=2 Tax=Phytophthora nicotianae TaxID=4792 RepID=W2JHP4_PHYNI|nr:hypothetical protein L916_04081 [Phytophthora nicotianae]ETM52260.1 hypothetical protein L914_04093 [Phytophthora nicotianae]ETO81297.1 hypothetical protein F444_04326 [Phytophthora nicotianae P1976]
MTIPRRSDTCMFARRSVQISLADVNLTRQLSGFNMIPWTSTNWHSGLHPFDNEKLHFEGMTSFH